MRAFGLPSRSEQTILDSRSWCSRSMSSSSTRELLADGQGGVGYLLKDRVLEGGSLLDAVSRVAEGGTVLDPEVVARLLGRRSRSQPLARLSPREA